MVSETHMKLCVTEPDFLGKFFFDQKLGERAQNGPKTGFFQFIGKFGHYFLLLLMEIYVICCVPPQIPYLGKSLFLRHGRKCSQLIRLQYFLINHISRTNQ